MNDCLWGSLDGINEDGLAVSLSFGGRQVVGAGFGVPLVLRYILEFCTTTDDATSVLERIPVHMSYNVTVLDASGKFATAYLRPDQPALIRAVPYAANHQEDIEWEQHARATATRVRVRGPRHGGVSESPALFKLVCERIRDALHGGLPPARGQRRIPLAGRAMAIRLRCVRRRNAHVPSGLGGGRRGRRGSTLRCDRY